MDCTIIFDSILDKILSVNCMVIADIDYAGLVLFSHWWSVVCKLLEGKANGGGDSTRSLVMPSLAIPKMDGDMASFSALMRMGQGW